MKEIRKEKKNLWHPGELEKRGVELTACYCFVVSKNYADTVDMAVLHFILIKRKGIP